MKINQFIVSKPTYNKSNKKWVLTKKDKITKKVFETIKKDTKQEAFATYEHLKKETKATLKVEPISKLEISTKLTVEKKDVKIKILKASDAIFDMLVQGTPRTVIMTTIANDFNLQIKQVSSILQEVLNSITSFTLSNIDDIIPVHVKRYDDIYRMCEKFGFDRLALKVMRAKEDLLKIGDDTVSIQINEMDFIDDHNFDEIVLLENEEKKFHEILNSVKK